MEAVDYLLYPIIVLMTLVLESFHRALGSYGMAIIGTSAVVRLVTHPISKAASRLEERERLTQAAMAPALLTVKETYGGRERFEAIEAIYQEHNYHPIKSLVSLLPLLLQIPFLLSALFLLVDYPPLVSEKTLFISDLSKPDGLLPLGGFAINLLPVCLTAVAVVDSLINPRSTKQSQIRFLFVAAVLLVLIYPLPAAVCLYWLASNLWSFSATMRLRLRQKHQLRTAI